MPRCAQDEAQDVGDHAVKLLGNLFIELELGQRLGKLGVLFQRHAMLARHVDDLLAKPAATGRHHARRAIFGLVVSQRYRELVGSLAHDARSTNCPAAAAGRFGVPKKNATSGTTSESLSASLSSASLSRRM